MPVALTTPVIAPSVANLDWISFTVDKNGRDPVTGLASPMVVIVYWEQDSVSSNIRQKTTQMTWANFKTAVGAQAGTLDQKVAAALAVALGLVPGTSATIS